MPSQWVDHSKSTSGILVVCKLQHTDSLPVTVTRSVTVYDDFTWCIHVHGRALDASKCSALNSFGPTIDTKTALNQLLKLVDTLNICAGHPDQHFLKLADSRKGKFLSVAQSTIATLDANYPIVLNGQICSRTIRTTSCEILIHGSKCEACRKYRPSLRSMHSQWVRQLRSSPEKNTDVSTHTNYRYLRTPQRKEQMSKLRAEVRRQRNEVKRLRSMLNEAMEQEGIVVDKQLENDLHTIMLEHTKEVNMKYAKDSFHLLFWDQQLRVLKTKDKRQVRWHPMMIRWCLSLKLLSSASYNALRSSNLLLLPSERTLRDYTHFIKAKPGFDPRVDEQLCREAKIDSVPEYQKYVCLVFDEIKVKEDLVYDKNSLSLMGFINMGDVNDHLSKFEEYASSVTPKPNLATHILTFMVSGILSDLEFPYVSFPCSSLSGDQLYSLVWGCVRRLEACGFKPIAFTCDGASANRKFLKLHKSPNGITYKTNNPYANEDRPIFFISDPPHLIKTVRNSWANSYSHNCTRKLWVCKHIHIIWLRTYV